MIISVFIILALLLLIIGSYTDIKTLEVPDWLSYTAIAVGIAGNLLYSIYYSDPLFIIRCITGFVIALALGFLMYYTGQWGGGDSKVLFALGALLGMSFPITITTLISDFFPVFLINMLFAGAAYGLIWIFIKAVQNRKKISKKIGVSLKKYAKLRLITGIIALATMAAVYFLPYIEPELKVSLAIIIFLLYSMNYLFAIVKAVEDTAMIKLIDPEKLTEGDWIVDEIKIDGKYITGPKDLGIEKKKIQELLKLKQEGKIKKVKVKYGIPFVPSFLIAFVYTMITESTVLLALL